ncbi:MAG: TetR/AcrR family transcriptional regulator [Ignavibacteria bacterium]|jgi:AcrR family transcriptional regulator
MKVHNDDIKETVFNKTLELLAKYGVRGWNMDDLARESNMSKRTLYKIIGNKEDLILKCIVTGMQYNINILEKFLTSEKPFPALLKQFIDVVTDNFQEYILKNISAIRIEYPKVQIEEDKHLIERERLLISFFKKGKKESYLVEYANPVTVYKTVNAIVSYNISVCDNKTDFKNETTETLGLFFKGLLK